MKLNEWFADQVVQRSQELSDLYVRYLDADDQTSQGHGGANADSVADTLLVELRQAHSRWVLATKSFEDILYTAIGDAPTDEGESTEDPPWDF